MHDVVFQAFSGVSLLLVLLPISWHIRAVNTGTLSLIFYVFFGNLFYFVNSVVWFNALWDPAPVWCDITAKFQVGMSVGIPAACLCTNRRLYLIATMQLPQLDGPSLRRLAFKELSLTAGLPAAVMVLHYIVQGRRYDIVQGVGCWAHTYWCWNAIWLVFQWPFTLGLASLAYGGEHGFKRSSRYIRLMALSCGEMAFTLPLGFWIFYLSVGDAGINPWISWDYVHAHWYDIEFRSDLILQSTPLEWVVTSLTRWCLPVSAIAFFVFFGLSGGAMQEYMKALRFVLNKLHIKIPYGFPQTGHMSLLTSPQYTHAQRRAGGNILSI
ncbi:fungal pheromone STE3G-protein-coupled receptor [Dacryopinax primogenitus]|uniref:Fungal pheromone STE3G-protein-coupled receptor n=1 Tax=Dacryopinax primogenitus (strain DJM 731) TaxID=1858805 RepID=M5FSK7_DACPD|nr:fungal pheromone STE3G-protein-coupled receptor [Dacryopinax primogenitus]EJU00446.1 fungal pheromone STE3G-protein-coupled receptor [Dacryopinax primogenitus]